MRILFSRIALKHICDVKNPLVHVGHGLPISVNGKVFLSFCEDFIFMKLCVKIKPSQKIELPVSSRARGLM